MKQDALTRDLGLSFMTAPAYFGQALDQTGQTFYFNTSSPFATGFQAGNATAAVTYTWPTAGPATSGDFLSSTTSGVLSWNSILSFSGDITITGAGKGLVVTTPDGTHTYRIAIDNSGSLTTELVT